MSPVDLARFVLGDACQNDRQVLGMLEQALMSETEPLRFFALYLKIDETEIYSRAARWCGLAFSPDIPEMVPANPRIVRLDTLANVRTLRARLFDRDVLFTSAGFSELLRIRRQLEIQPELASRICLVPPRAIRSGVNERCADLLLNQARTQLARRWPFASAHLDLGLPTRLVFGFCLVLLVLLAALTPFVLYPVLVPLLAFILLTPALFRLVAAISSLDPDLEPVVAPVPDADLPVYSVLVPLRDEANMVNQLVGALSRIDYPREKLDIKFVVESSSPETVEAVRQALDDPCFELVVVPDQKPHTKPKALNYALPLVRGEFVVVYDAEDIPEPDQLRRAVACFRDQPGLDCLQAELVIDNADENWLSALFCAEYAGLFGLVLPALSRWKLPLPLGGTSNHFRLQSLREVGGWDAFNVTEDADLGIRLSRLRYRTGTFSSRTYEEAPITIRGWLAQRTRWMKGWMQTFIVHNRHPVAFFKDMGWRNFLIFQAFVGGLIVSAPLHTVFVLVLAFRAATGAALGIFPQDIWHQIMLGIFLTGYGSAIAVSTLGLKRIGLPRLAPYQFLLPLYWGLNSLAAANAIYELFFKPYYWAKTAHGLTRFARGTGIETN